MVNLPFEVKTVFPVHCQYIYAGDVEWIMWTTLDVDKNNACDLEQLYEL